MTFKANDLSKARKLVAQFTPEEMTWSEFRDMLREEFGWDYSRATLVASAVWGS